MAPKKGQATPIMALACDHRVQLEDIARSVEAPFERISDFKLLVVQAAVRVAAGRPGFGMFLDGRPGRETLFAASHAGLWVARPIEQTGSRPLDFETSGSLGAQLVEWPVDQVVECLCFYHPGDDEALRLRPDRELNRAQDACRRLGRYAAKGDEPAAGAAAAGRRFRRPGSGPGAAADRGFWRRHGHRQ